MAQPPALFDRTLLRARRKRAAAQGPATFLLDHVAADLAERLSAVLRSFERAADLGTPDDRVRRLLLERKLIGTFVSGGAEGDAIADEEALPFAERFARSRRLGAVAAIRQ